MENTSSIALIDNTVPSQQPASDDLSRSSTYAERSSLSKKLSRGSVKNELIRRKYAKWQPHKLGIAEDNNVSSREASQARESSVTDTRIVTEESGPSGQQNHESHPVASTDFASSDEQGNGRTNDESAQPAAAEGHNSHSELDILYENQRGWFFFGIPLYSSKSLLNFDSSAWVTQDLRASAVNITNAQLPDPSWEWAWKTWYVDMSGDVDDQGWQYSFSFASSAWHGTHPWFHSFVRRRRWVRLRVKRASERKSRGRSNFEMAHMLNEDYFTIHSSKKRTRESSAGPSSHVASAYLSRSSTRVDEEVNLEDVTNIPALLYALRSAVVDRQKIDALKKFIEDGGEELYYLEQTIPEIMSLFVFQTSRWQFLTYMIGVINELSHKISEAKEDTDAEEIKRKRDNLSKAAEEAKNHITGPDVFVDIQGESVTGMLDLTPISKQEGLLSLHPRRSNDEPMNSGKSIKGIPKEAEIGREGHIY